MIKKLQSRCLPMDPSPRDIVTIQVKDTTSEQQYRVILDENPSGSFTMKIAEGCIFAKDSPTNKTEFVCIGRS